MMIRKMIYHAGMLILYSAIATYYKQYGTQENARQVEIRNTEVVRNDGTTVTKVS